MINISEITKEEVSKIKYVLTDIDGTLTNDTVLLPETYTAIFRLRKAGFKVIPVTGRTAGWCTICSAEWPVDAVVAESGGIVFYLENGVRKAFVHPSIPKNTAELRQKVYDAVHGKYPALPLSIDQFSRFNDLAFNYADDGSDFSYEVAKDVLRIANSLGANGNISSIHINSWFGDYDKLPMVLLFFKDVLKIKNPSECSVYFGDATNDEPMFEHFKMSCGVRNIEKYADRMAHFPKYITDGEGGIGFAEAADILIKLKSQI